MLASRYQGSQPAMKSRGFGDRLLPFGLPKFSKGCVLEGCAETGSSMECVQKLAATHEAGLSFLDGTTFLGLTHFLQEG